MASRWIGVSLRKRFALILIGFSLVPLVVAGVILAEGMVGIKDRVTKSAEKRVSSYQTQAIKTFTEDQAYFIQERIETFRHTFLGLAERIESKLAKITPQTPEPFRAKGLSIHSVEVEGFLWPDTLTGFTKPKKGNLQQAIWAPGAVQRDSSSAERIIAQHMFRYRKIFGDNIRHIYFSYPDGSSVIYPRTKGFTKTFEARLRPWFGAALAADKPILVRPYTDLDTGAMIMAVSMNLQDEKGNSIGVLAVEMDFDYFLSLPNERSGWTAMSGVALVEKSPNDQFSLLSLIRHNKEAVGHEALMNAEAILHDKQVADLLNSTDEKGTGWADFPEVGSVFVSWNRVEGSYHLVTFLPLEKWVLSSQDLNESLRHSLSLIGPKGLLILIVVMVLSVIAARKATWSMVSPIRRLRLVANRVAQGDFSERCEVERLDELGDLAKDLDKMAESLLEAKQVEEARTMQMASSMMRALERRDTYTAAHSGRVGRYSRMLGNELGLSKEDCQVLYRGALMHDIGKIGVPDAILNKPDSLTDEEYSIMKEHPEQGLTILKPITSFKVYAEIAGYHHERWDGEGYPEGLSGEEIPLFARIVSIADTFDTLLNGRVYRKSMSREDVLALMEREADSGQWDPNLVRTFIRVIRRQAARA